MNRSLLRTELWLVLGLSLGASALWSVVQLLDLLTRPEGLAGSTTSMNTPVAPDRPWLTVLDETVGLVVALVPAAMAVFLLGRERDETAPLRAGLWRLGADGRRPVRDLGTGALLAALIGIPGLGLYLVATHLGVNTTVAAAPESPAWWAALPLVLSAVRNGVLEELVLGYVVVRCRDLGRGAAWAVVAAALLRGTYHLYQGFGGGVGNVVMGLVFGAWFVRTGRVAPLVVAHVLIDLVAFLGYAWAAPHLSWV